MSRKESATITVAKITVIGTIVVAAIGLIGSLITKAQNPPAIAGASQEYIGRVLDANTLFPIPNAKITLDLEGVPPVVYTDSEGVYRFDAVIKTDISGQVRVDAIDYQVYTRNISISPDDPKIDDIRLTPLPKTATACGAAPGRCAGAPDGCCAPRSS